MPTIPVTKCPECGGTTIEATAFADADLDDPLTCPACGHHATKREFVAHLVGEGAKIAQDIFGKIPGFRRK